MVMMLGQVLGELEPHELVACGNVPHNTGGPKVGEMSVRRAPGDLREAVCDVGDTHRMAERAKKFDDGSTAGRVALVGTAEPHLNELVEIIASWSCLQSWPLSASSKAPNTSSPRLGPRGRLRRALYCLSCNETGSQYMMRT